MKTILIGALIIFSCFEYDAKVLSVYDGDTITVQMDLGLGITKTEVIRLYGIDAPELRGQTKSQGMITRDSLRSWIMDKDIIVKTEQDKRGKYGRLLGTVILNGENLNDKLVAKGLAVFKEY